MNKKRVALICPSDFPVPSVKGGAIETLMQNIIVENEKYKELELYIYSHYNEEAESESKKYISTKFVFIRMDTLIIKIQTLTNKILRKFFKKPYHDMFIESVAKDLLKKNIDTIVVEGNKFYVDTLNNKLKDKKIYLHIHHDAFNDEIEKNIEITNACKKIIVVSDFIKEQTCNKEYISNQKVETLMNGIDLNKFNKSNYSDERDYLRNKYGIKENEKVILFSGRLLEIKGIRELILSFKKYCSKEDAKLLIVGNSGFACTKFTEYDKQLKNLSKEIEDKIIFTGFIHNDQLPKIHSISDIAVVPSIWDEPAGLVVIEAMASGLPVIVTDSGGIPEYTNRECAIIVKRDESLIDNLGESLLELIKDDSRRLELGGKAREYALRFNTNRYYKDFIKIIN